MLWESGARVRTEKLDKRNRPAAASAATDGKHVTVFFGDYGLVTYDVDGKELWKQPLGPFNNVYGMGASPLIIGNTVIIACDQLTNNFIARLRQEDGQGAVENAAHGSQERPRDADHVDAERREAADHPAGILPPYRLRSRQRQADLVGRRPVLRDQVHSLSSRTASSTSTASALPRTTPGRKIDVMTTDEAFAKADADKDGRIARADSPTPHAGGD